MLTSTQKGVHILRRFVDVPRRSIPTTEPLADRLRLPVDEEMKGMRPGHGTI